MWLVKSETGQRVHAFSIKMSHIGDKQFLQFSVLWFGFRLRNVKRSVHYCDKVQPSCAFSRLLFEADCTGPRIVWLVRPQRPVWKEVISKAEWTIEKFHKYRTDFRASQIKLGKRVQKNFWNCLWKSLGHYKKVEISCCEEAPANWRLTYRYKNVPRVCFCA